MGRQKFPIGSFVCAKGHEDVACFYVYDFLGERSQPYRLISLKRNRIYCTTAIKLEFVSSINIILYCLMNKKPSTFNAIRKGNRLRSRPNESRWLHVYGFRPYNF